MTKPTLLRTSERSCFKACEFKHDLEFNRRLKPQVSAPPLRFGWLIHASLERFYRPGMKRGKKPYLYFDKLYKQNIIDTEQRFKVRVEDDWHDAGELGHEMLKHYWNKYGKDERYFVVATEQPFQVPVYVGGDHVFTYVGVLDGIWRDLEKKKLLIVDHKTTGSIDSLVNSLALSDQAGSYWTFGVDWIYERGLLKPRQKLNGLLYNIMRKAAPDEDRARNSLGQYLNKPKKQDLLYEYKRRGLEPLRASKDRKPGTATVDQMIEDLGPDCLQYGEVSKVQPPPFFHRHTEWRSEADRKTQRQRAIDEEERISMVRDGTLPVLKSPGERNCNGCAYKDPCELHESGQDWELLLNAQYRKWDPYAEHEIYDRN